jgi:hypothetical protein
MQASQTNDDFFSCMYLTPSFFSLSLPYLPFFIIATMASKQQPTKEQANNAAVPTLHSNG